MNRELNWFIENYRLAYEGRLINGDVGMSQLYNAYYMYLHVHVCTCSTGK